MKIELNDKISNQDNSRMWVNPLLKTKKGKVLLLMFFVPFIIVLIFALDWKKVFINNKEIFLSQILLTLISSIYVFVKYLISKVTIYRKEISYDVVDKKYYRELLDENSCGVLSYVYNKKIEYKDIIISTILRLEKEGVIELDYKNKLIKFSIIKFLSVDSIKLYEYEKYFLNLLFSNENYECIPFSKMKKILVNENFKVNFIGLIKKATKESGYFKSNEFGHNIMIYVVILNFLFMIYGDYLIFGGEIFIFVFFNTLILFYLCYIENKKIYIRTKKGKELNIKLKGLKNFLVDFSIINDREIEEIILWDYYILYAIIFDLKGNLGNNVKELYRQI